ncbi:MAG: outer membrane beta-barrel protein [Flavobacteriales bacterium]
MKLTGIIYDTSNVVPLKNVSVMALRLKDSVLLNFTRTNQLGEFELSGFPIDTFQLIIEHPRLETKTYYIIGSKDNYDIKVPRIQLQQKTQNIREVTVITNKNAIYFRGDTLVYVADSFKVGQNAVVEDLLKKLPGIKVSDDGSITSQGKEISKVLVDGDEFFGTDPTIATRNLGANGVASVQVYEKKNEDAAVGEDDKIQVLDLKLKDSAKKGYFGKISGASDFGLVRDNPFYEGEVLLNNFNKKQKISVFMLTSNTPKSNFGFGDMNKFGLDNERNNSGMTMWDQSSKNNSSGIPQTMKAGIYYADRIGKTGKIGFNYSYYENRLNAVTSSQSQYFLQDSSYFTKDSTSNVSKNQSHRFNLTYSTNIDSLTYLELRPNLHVDFGESNNLSQNTFLDEAFSPYLNTSVRNTNASKGLSSNSEAILRRKFKKVNRELELKYILNANTNQSDGNLYTLKTGAQSDTIDQEKINNNGTTTNYGILTYTEPIAKKLKVQVEYYLESGKSNQTKRSLVRDAVGNYTQQDSMYTNEFDNTRFQQRGTGMLIFEHRQHTVTGGVGFRNIQVQSTNLITSVVTQQDIQNFLPKFSYQFKPGMSKRINLNYSTASSPAAINDLQPVQDNTNPNRLQIGNPNLKPNYVHNLRLNANVWQALTGRYFWGGANASLTNNAFASSTTYNQFGQTLTQTVNVNGNIFANVYAGGGLPVFNRKIEFAPNVNGSYNKYTNYINGQTNVTKTSSITAGLDIELKLDSLNITIGNSYSYNNPVSSLSSVSNQPYATQKYFIDGEWRLPQHFQVKADATYTINTGRAASYNKNIFIINFELSKAFLKTENVIIALSANDILNQNLNLQRQINGNVITDNYTKIISRYFLMKLTYKFNNNKTREDDFKGWH